MFFYAVLMDIYCTDKDWSDLCVVIVAFTVSMLKKQLRLIVVKILKYLKKNLNVFVFYCFQTFYSKGFGSQYIRKYSKYRSNILLRRMQDD
jgi:hypothetical protein